MQRIPLNRGMFALVDDQDFVLVSGYRWCVRDQRGKQYAIAGIGGKTVYMHRLIMGATERLTNVDHIDHNGLNNQRSNIRACTACENHRNKLPHRDSTSPYKGVSKRKNGNRWEASIFANGKRIYLGLFADPESAARAYDAAAIEHFGEYAHLNFPDVMVTRTAA